MQINNFFYVLILISSILYGRGGGHHFGSGGRRRGNHRQRHQSRHHEQSLHHNNYSHGGRNNFIGGIGNAESWGLMGGLGIGLLLGSALSNNNNVTVVNSYNNKDSNNQSNTDNYDTILKNLKSNIIEIEDLSKKITNETEQIKKNNSSAFIEVNFNPYNKIKIITKTSSELYGDFSKTKVQTVLFQSNQAIKNKIEKIRHDIKSNLETIISLTDNDNKNKLNEIKNHLIEALKILNITLVNTVKIIQE